MKQIINLTKKPVNISGVGTFPACPPDLAARLNSPLTHIGEFDGIELCATLNVEAINVPPPKKDTLFIVPNHVRQELPNRKDLASPAKFIKDSTGNIVSCCVLIVNH